MRARRCARSAAAIRAGVQPWEIPLVHQNPPSSLESRLLRLGPSLRSSLPRLFHSSGAPAFDPIPIGGREPLQPWETLPVVVPAPLLDRIPPTFPTTPPPLPLVISPSSRPTDLHPVLQTTP